MTRKHFGRPVQPVARSCATKPEKNVDHMERAVLTGALLRMKAEAEDPQAPDRNKPGLRSACRVLQNLIRGDEEPPVQPTGANRVHLEVEIDFQGDYFEPGELVGVVKDWFEMASEDREDVQEVRMQGVVRAIREGEG